jgi:hypothetical protein
VTTLFFAPLSSFGAGVCAETSDPWGGRIGSTGSRATDGYGVLQSIIGGLPRESGWLNLGSGWKPNVRLQATVASYMWQATSAAKGVGNKVGASQLAASKCAWVQDCERSELSEATHLAAAAADVLLMCC